MAGKEMTGAEAGLTGDDQVRIGLEVMVNRGGESSMGDIYTAVEERMLPNVLSQQGRASLRFFINRVAVRAGYVQPYDKANPGWRITAEGRDYCSEPQPAKTMEVVNLDTNVTEEVPSNVVRGQAFELYVLSLLKVLYPNHAWFHQGRHKSTERGLDFIGNRIGENLNATEGVIGVQAKFHNPNNVPKTDEWLKFLAGSFARRLDKALFITTGRLTSEQRREAGEANVLVIEGRDEISRIANTHGVDRFDLFDDQPNEIGVDEPDPR